MRTRSSVVIRFSVVAAIVAALSTLAVLRASVALAHHVDLEATYTCDAFEFRADYVGGSSDRYAEIRVNGVLTQTIQLPGSGPDFIDDFYVLTGSLPTDTTVEIRLYVPQTGTDSLESTVSATVDEDNTCTPTATPTAPTNTPVPSASSTPPATDTPQPTDTPESATETPPAPTSTPVNPTSSPTSAPPTSTPRPDTPTSVRSTSTPVAEGTPTFVSTVEALLPPGQPGTGGTPPQETASGLPNAGTGARNATTLFGVGLLMLAAGLLGVTTIALRRLK